MSDVENLSQLRKDLRFSGLITLSVAPGILILGLVLGLLSTMKIFGILFAVSTLIAFVGAALFAGAWFYPDDSYDDESVEV
ncbi:MAG: hypothetical protein GKR90_01155 [Pseudomonadales bacterium]|nr:hypothetical protein [Pseudomonadales bacterium]